MNAGVGLAVAATGAAYLDADGCDLAAFTALTDRTIPVTDLRFAAEVTQRVPVYAVPALGAVLADPAARRALMAEWAWLLGQGPGVLVLRSVWSDLAPLDRATAIHDAIIAAEKAASGGRGDHFAAAGANDRIWNSLQKLCLADPEVFALYFGSPAIAAVCEAWLGPAYQMTAQVNLVRPGGAAQRAHRDYHLGFQTVADAALFPAHVHALSPYLTLQGAVAHVDMPVDSGPTKLLPFSQLYPAGYLAYHREDFRALFEARCVQVPLSRGDAVFFSPALFHAGGQNRTADVQRMANLLQVSSAMGRAMETVDRTAMCRRLYPAIRALRAAGRLTEAEADAAIAAAAEGYAFPTNLDTDPPVGGLAPETQAALFRRALAAGMPDDAFGQALDAQAQRRTA
jgi:ectoine hydroxylase-related dioxygenase (phytanoyl-CoA dioxygenase family)